MRKERTPKIALKKQQQRMQKRKFEKRLHSTPEIKTNQFSKKSKTSINPKKNVIDTNINLSKLTNINNKVNFPKFKYKNVTTWVIILLLIFSSYAFLFAGHQSTTRIGHQTFARYNGFEYQKSLFFQNNQVNGLIVFPENKVNSYAYSYLGGISNASVLIPKRLFDNNFFNQSFVTNSFELFPNIDNWFLVGKGAQGQAVLDFAKANPEKVKGVILLDSNIKGDYSSLDKLKVLSIVPTIPEQPKYYDDHKAKLPKDAQVISIDEGTHLGFSLLEPSMSDTGGKLTAEQQQKKINDSIRSFIDKAVAKTPEKK